ncbi:hypothetical protein WICPIJ_004592 [Wickerhamomyces pijperi]|uniref:Uncharacterized protein n=1 Tax=Wickerhamomyces pijperi TaxID=599730 RepID=A0A9P8TLW7_WICPI|nr:hypothetical protein WICPIJ_004592 [Wickerhamomyces pijperi]
MKAHFHFQLPHLLVFISLLLQKCQSKEIYRAYNESMYCQKLAPNDNIVLKLAASAEDFYSVTNFSMFHTDLIMYKVSSLVPDWDYELSNGSYSNRTQFMGEQYHQKFNADFQDLTLRVSDNITGSSQDFPFYDHSKVLEYHSNISFTEPRQQFKFNNTEYGYYCIQLRHNLDHNKTLTADHWEQVHDSNTRGWVRNHDDYTYNATDGYYYNFNGTVDKGFYKTYHESYSFMNPVVEHDPAKVLDIEYGKYIIYRLWMIFFVFVPVFMFLLIVRLGLWYQGQVHMYKLMDYFLRAFLLILGGLLVHIFGMFVLKVADNSFWRSCKDDFISFLTMIGTLAYDIFTAFVLTKPIKYSLHYQGSLVEQLDNEGSSVMVPTFKRRSYAFPTLWTKYDKFLFETSIFFPAALVFFFLQVPTHSFLAQNKVHSNVVMPVTDPEGLNFQGFHLIFSIAFAVFMFFLTFHNGLSCIAPLLPDNSTGEINSALPGVRFTEAGHSRRQKFQLWLFLCCCTYFLVGTCLIILSKSIISRSEAALFKDEYLQSSWCFWYCAIDITFWAICAFIPLCVWYREISHALFTEFKEPCTK